MKTVQYVTYASFKNGVLQATKTVPLLSMKKGCSLSEIENKSNKRDVKRSK